MYAQGHLILIYLQVYCEIIQTFYKLVYEFLQKLPVLQWSDPCQIDSLKKATYAA